MPRAFLIARNEREEVNQAFLVAVTTTDDVFDRSPGQYNIVAEISKDLLKTTGIAFSCYTVERSLCLKTLADPFTLG